MPGERQYKATLTEDEREQLRKMLTSGKAARKLNHARILLYADASAAGLRRTDQEIAEGVGVGLCTVARGRQRFVAEGYAAALLSHQALRHSRGHPLERARLRTSAGSHRYAVRIAGPDVSFRRVSSTPVRKLPLERALP